MRTIKYIYCAICDGNHFDGETLIFNNHYPNGKIISNKICANSPTHSHMADIREVTLPEGI